MNNKLRLVVTDKCHNKCSMCCNNRFDLKSLPVVDRWDYDEIMVTGGEPMLFPYAVYNLLFILKTLSAYTDKRPRLYMYTALPTFSVLKLLNLLDGVVVTPHTLKDVTKLIHLNSRLIEGKEKFIEKSLRLNLFPEVRKLIPYDTDLSMWKIKEIQWIKDCPVPVGEDLRRINDLL